MSFFHFPLSIFDFSFVIAQDDAQPMRNKK